MLQFTCLSPCGAYVHVLEILRGFMSWDHCASTQVRYLYLFHNQQVVPDFHLSLTPTPPPSHRHTKSQKYNSLNTCFFFFFLLSRPFGNTIFTSNRSWITYNSVILSFCYFLCWSFHCLILNNKSEAWATLKEDNNDKKSKEVLIHVICFLQCSAPISILDETKTMLDMNRLFLCSWP